MLRLTRKRLGKGQSMTEQVPEDLTEAEVADRLDVDRSEDEGARDRASEVDAGKTRAGTTAPLSLPAHERCASAAPSKVRAELARVIVDVRGQQPSLRRTESGAGAVINQGLPGRSRPPAPAHFP